MREGGKKFPTQLMRDICSTRLSSSFALRVLSRRDCQWESLDRCRSSTISQRVSLLNVCEWEGRDGETAATVEEIEGSTSPRTTTDAGGCGIENVLGWIPDLLPKLPKRSVLHDACKSGT